MKLVQKSIIALALAMAIVPGGAYAKPHRQITDAQRGDCLTTDNDPDGTEWCVKSSKGLSQAQIDEWYVEEVKRSAAQHKARLAAIEIPNLENCTRVMLTPKFTASGRTAPSQAKTIAAHSPRKLKPQLTAAFEARIHHAKNTDIMAQCYQMVDVPSLDWEEVPPHHRYFKRLRHSWRRLY